MEQLDTREIIKDWDPTLQPRVAPRYKTWLPLATQQLRLRSLIRIIGHNLDCNEKEETRWYYYTIHRTSMSSPLYTSEPIDSVSPRWASLEVPTLYSTDHSTASEIVLRLWKRTKANDPSSDTTVFTSCLSLSRLIYLGSKLSPNLDTILCDNTVIFQFQGGYFAPSEKFQNKPDLNKYLYMLINTSEVKNSYDVDKLKSLRNMMQALKQQSDSVKNLRERIANGVYVPKFPQTALNRLLQPKRVSKEKRAEILRVRKELEDVKFRTKLLEQERVRKMGEVRALNQRHSDIVEENQDQGSDLMNRYRELNKDIERLCEWRQGHLEKRDNFIQLTGHLVRKQRQLISDMSLIYPIKQESDGKYKINDVHLPDSESLGKGNDSSVAVALGFVAHTTQMLANFLNVPLRYKVVYFGSRSKIVDHITQNIPDHDRQFPLYIKGKDRLRFHYAVYLLNKNIAQLKWYCGLTTTDLRATLPNLANLIASKPNQPLDNSKRTYSGTSLDTEPANAKQSAPLTPPIQKVLFEKCHRTSRSMGQLKSSKFLFGASLDQGLDKPIQSLNLDSRSKRICKSEESAIDDNALTLPRDVCSSLSSNETLNDTIFKQTPKPNKNATILGDHIEILLPTSVSKPKTNCEVSVSVRQRSSNSISSCEMALSSSQLDGDDSSNGNSSVKHDESFEQIKSNCETDPLLEETDMDFKNAIDRKEEEKEELDQDEENEEEQPLLPNNSDSSRLLGDVMISRDKTLASSLSEHIEVARNEERTRRRCESESRRGPETDSLWTLSEFSKALENQLKQSSSVSMTTINNPSEIPSLFPSDERQEDAKDFQTKYIDSIRRSTENVFARTEALANKKTSFKVMRPRT